jgi:pteridine reductase
MTAPRPIALVTGAAKRVGAAIAHQLAASGCDVLITYNTSDDAAQKTVASLRKLGVAATAIPLDITDEEDLLRTAKHLAKELPRLDVLVHNASRYEPSPLGTIDAARLVEDYRVHAAGPLLLTQSLWPLLKRSVLEGGGSVVAMADMHVLGRPRKEFASYSMSKAALVEMVQTLARAMAPKVRVNAVAPGVVEWPTSGSEASAKLRAAYLRRVPLGRAGTPQDAANAVAWLALEAPYITGEILRVDGGRWLA